MEVGIGVLGGAFVALPCAVSVRCMPLYVVDEHEGALVTRVGWVVLHVGR